MTTSSRDIRMANGSAIALTGAGEALRGLPDAVVIRLDEPETECIACGAECRKAWGLPMYEGWFLEANDPGEWGGFDACRECNGAYAAGGIAALMYRLAAMEGNDRAQSLVRTWEAMGGRA